MILTSPCNGRAVRVQLKEGVGTAALASDEGNKVRGVAHDQQSHIWGSTGEYTAEEAGKTCNGSSDWLLTTARLPAEPVVDGLLLIHKAHLIHNWILELQHLQHKEAHAIF